MGRKLKKSEIIFYRIVLLGVILLPFFPFSRKFVSQNIKTYENRKKQKELNSEIMKSSLKIREKGFYKEDEAKVH